MNDVIYETIKSKPKFNIFRDYITFLSDNNELNPEEKRILNTEAHEFLKTLETTNMTKSYKIPIFLAFYNESNIKMQISDDDVYKSMHKFYNYSSNGVDMFKHKKTKDYKNWSKKEYVSLAYNNPIKYLNKSSSEFFIKKDNCALALSDNLKEFIHLDAFKKHFKDIIEYRTIDYYKSRFEKNELL